MGPVPFSGGWALFSGRDRSLHNIRYRKSELELIAEIAPTLKEAELRVLLELARRCDPHTHTYPASAKLTALDIAVEQLVQQHTSGAVIDAAWAAS
jgi:hypothetical protein